MIPFKHYSFVEDFVLSLLQRSFFVLVGRNVHSNCVLVKQDLIGMYFSLAFQRLLYCLLIL